MQTLPYNSNRLFIASCLALVVTAMTFSIRAGILGQLSTDFGLTDADLGWINATAFLGFPIAMLIGGPLCDVLGMGFLLTLAFVGHLLGIGLTIYAQGFWGLFLSTFLIGFANGMVEAACNPLVTALYPKEKTKMLNRFHMWFPGGLLIGGLISYFFSYLGFSWQSLLTTMILPTAVYGFLFLNQTFPATERVSTGVSQSEMIKACFSPLYLVMIFCMFLTATTELGTNQWIAKIMESTTSNAVLLIVFISGIMATGRYFAGWVEQRLSPVLMLLYSAILSVVGLYLLATLEGQAVFLAAGVFALGVCFFWPTMLGFTAEYIPKSGALGLALMGGAGMFATSIFNPIIGKFLDWGRNDALAKGFSMHEAELKAGQAALLYMCSFPLILVFIFALLYLNRRRFEHQSSGIH